MKRRIEIIIALVLCCVSTIYSQSFSLEDILEDIYNIGDKLGTLMAMCGKVGLCGADLIITKDGEIFEW